MLGSAAIGIAASLIAASAHAAGTCVQTRVTESFVSPDGRDRGPGVLKVCPYWTISPSLRLSKVALDGVTLGIWMTRAGEGGKLPDSSLIVLRHLPGGRIALADHYWPGRDGRPVAPGLRAANREAPTAAEAPTH
jgi:hypothetical protein